MSIIGLLLVFALGWFVGALVYVARLPPVIRTQIREWRADVASLRDGDKDRLPGDDTDDAVMEQKWGRSA